MTIAIKPGVIALIASAMCIASSSQVRAQSAEAEVLFREGKKLMKQGETTSACDKFDASEKIEPSIGAEMNLGDCREKAGQLATAWGVFVKAQQTAKHLGDRRKGAEAQRRAKALESKLVHLTIEVSEDARLEGLVVKRNDVRLEPGQYGQRVPVDADDYVITAEAPGHLPFKRKITVGKKNKIVEVPILEDAPAPSVATTAVKPVPSSPIVQASTQPAAPAEPSSFTTTRKLAVVLAVVGGAAGAGGIVYGIKAKDLEKESDAVCPTTRCSDPSAFDLNKKAHDDALLANIGMIGGGAVVAGALVLWFVGGPSRSDGVAIAPSIGTNSIGIAGRF